MRSLEDVQNILLCHRQGMNKSEIARNLGIPRGTVRDILKKYDRVAQRQEATDLKSVQYGFESHPGYHFSLASFLQDKETEYSYVLGFYLGDGYITRWNRSFKIRFSCDTKYPNIIEELSKNIQRLLPTHKVETVPIKNANCVEVYCYFSHWPDVIPQHGKGKKHNRKIQLESWQKEIVTRNSRALLRGMIHSDGTRYIAIQNGYPYPRYSFSNRSEDIHDVFRLALDRIGVEYYDTGYHTDVNKREAVELLDHFIGPKT